jgi:hypothetical protein
MVLFVVDDEIVGSWWEVLSWRLGGERTNGLEKRFLHTYLKIQRNLNPANTEELLEDNS